MSANMTKQGRAITKALREMVEAARAAGCDNPKLFFEPESHSIFVLDGNHPGYVRADARVAARQEAIVARAPLGDPGASFDAGAW